MKSVKFAASTVGSYWYEAGVVLKRSLARRGIDLELNTRTTDFNNALSVGRGESDVGVTLPLFVDWAERRQDVFKGAELKELRVIAALTKPTWLAPAISVEAKSNSLDGLAQERFPWGVVIPPPDNLVGKYIDRILELHGITRANISDWGGTTFPPNALGPRSETPGQPWVMRTQTRELALQGAVNGFFLYVNWTSAWARDLTTLLDMKFLSANSGALDQVVRELGGERLRLPARLFRGLSDDVDVLGWRHEYVYGTVDTSPDLVRSILEALGDQDVVENAHGLSFSRCSQPQLPSALRYHDVSADYCKVR